MKMKNSFTLKTYKIELRIKNQLNSINLIQLNRGNKKFKKKKASKHANELLINLPHLGRHANEIRGANRHANEEMYANELPVRWARMVTTAISAATVHDRQ